MKKITVLTFLLFLVSSKINAQQKADNVLNGLMQSMKTYESAYQCKATANKKTGEYVAPKAINSLTFDSLYFLSSSRILSSSTDLYKNGRSATLDFNEGLKRLSINYSWMNNDKNGKIWNAGLIAEDASKKSFEIFGKKGWKDGFTFNLGQAIPIFKKSILFLPSDCETLKKKRNIHYTQLLNNYETILLTPQSTIDDIKTRISLIKDFDIANPISFSKVPEPVTEEEKKLVETWDLLYGYLTDTTAKAKIELDYQKAVTDLEVKNFKKYGYKVRWFNWNISGGLKRFALYDTAVVRVAEISKTNLPRFTAVGSYSFFRESVYKRITYFSVEMSVGNMNYVDEILPSEVSILKATTPAGTIKEDYDALVLKDYASLKKGYAFLGIGGVLNYFPGKLDKKGKLGRFLGFELGGSTKLKGFVPKGVPARDVFSLRGGLLFTFESDKVAKTTFGILATLTDIPYNDITSKDRFGVAIRIGVPFNY
jgi:hypothetical protein